MNTLPTPGRTNITQCVAAAVLLLAPGCTEILNIDVIYEDGGGGSGAGGPSNGGNGASVSDGGSGAGSSDGGNGGGPSTGGAGGGGGPMCAPSPAKATCTAAEFASGVGVCWEPLFDPSSGQTIVAASGGSLHMEPHNVSHGFWTVMDDPQGPDRGSFLWRNIDGPFAVVTRAKATLPNDDTMPPAGDGSYRMAGLLMREPLPFDGPEERWVKLEVGRRAAGLTNGGGAIDPLGVLAAVSKNDPLLEGANVARHLRPYPEEVEHEAWLGMCRAGSNFFAMYRYASNGGAFVSHGDSAGEMGNVSFPDCVQVGLTVASYEGPASMEGHFEAVRFMEGAALTFPNAAVCGELLAELADSPPAGCAQCD